MALEGYELVVNKAKAHVTASSAVGMLLGVFSLVQITPLKKGETLLFPASMNNQTWETKGGQSLLLATLTHS
jgi:hypothetical protein